MLAGRLSGTLFQPQGAACLFAFLLLLVFFVFSFSSSSPHPLSSSSPTPSPIQDAKPTRQSLKDEKKTTQSPSPSGLNSLNWFDFDLPGLENARPNTLWAHPIPLVEPRTKFMQTHPQLAFIKGNKVGGTTIAIALDNIAQQLNIKLQEVPQGSTALEAQVECQSPSSLWFHHGAKSPWMSRCIPSVRYLTILREPLGQSLSWATFLLSRKYYQRYPATECKFTSTADFSTLLPEPLLVRMMDTVTSCQYTELRKNITMQLIAHQILAGKGRPQDAVDDTLKWVMGSSSTLPPAQELIFHLQHEYFLVGITEKLNEFLLLLALHMGWDPSSMYYIYCKPTDLNIHASEFRARFPREFEILRNNTREANVVYETMRDEFESNLARLTRGFPQFNDILAKYEAGLKKFQLEARVPGKALYRWKPYYYQDGRWEYC